MEPLERVELAGDAEARGTTHGERFAAEIERNVETYLERFAHHGVSEENVRDRAEAFLPVIETANPEYAAEMRAVAEASGVALDLVTMLNVRYEVIYTAWAEEAEGADEPDSLAPAAGVDGCTSFGLLPAATADGHTVMGQNWDWLAPVADTLFLMDVKPDDGAHHLAFTEAGIVGGKCGLNEHGLGTALNGLISERDGEEPYRKPVHVRCREILSADRFDRALGAVLDADRACSANFMLGADGEVLDLETGPEAYNVLHPDDDGVLTHANHFVDGDISRLGPTQEHGQTTLYRAERVRRALAREAGDVDEATVTRALRDHFGRPGSVCSHVDDDRPPVERGQTNASFVLDLTERTMLATRGPPCESEYARYDLEPGS